MICLRLIVYIMCNTGRSATRIADLVRQLGFMNVYPIEGGMELTSQNPEYHQYFEPIDPMADTNL